MVRGKIVLAVSAFIVVLNLAGCSSVSMGEKVSGVYAPPKYVSDIKLPSEKKPAWVYVYEDRLYINYFGSDKVDIFDPDKGEPLGSFSTALKTGHGMPQGMAMVNERLLVADYNNKALTFFDPQGKYLESFAGRYDQETFVPVGVAVYNRVFYITDASVNGWMAIGDDGELINVVKGKDELTFLEFPYGIVVTDDGRVVITDPRGARIKVFACPGWYAYDFAVKEAGVVNPQGIAMDSLGRFHVVDNGLNKVVVFDNKGHYLFKYGNNLMGPSTIAIDGRKQLIYIANTEKGSISVWKYEEGNRGAVK